MKFAENCPRSKHKLTIQIMSKFQSLKNKIIKFERAKSSWLFIESLKRIQVKYSKLTLYVRKIKYTLIGSNQHVLLTFWHRVVFCKFRATAIFQLHSYKKWTLELERGKLNSHDSLKKAQLGLTSRFHPWIMSWIQNCKLSGIFK